MKTNGSILVVDDEEIMRDILETLLKGEGYSVRLASSGEEGVELAKNVPFDAAIIDVMMPGMDGMQTLEALKKLDDELAVIMVTAFASVELAVEAMKLGAVDFVRKTMTPEILRNAVAGALGAPQKQRALEARKTFTMNGFAIVRASDLSGGAPNERRFVVRRPDGSEQEVVIEIGEEAIRGVESSGITISLDDPFWTQEAEHFLSDFIWNDGNVPGTGKLKLRGVEATDLADFTKTGKLK